MNTTTNATTAAQTHAAATPQGRPATPPPTRFKRAWKAHGKKIIIAALVLFGALVIFPHLKQYFSSSESSKSAPKEQAATAPSATGTEIALKDLREENRVLHEKLMKEQVATRAVQPETEVRAEQPEEPAYKPMGQVVPRGTVSPQASPAAPSPRMVKRLTPPSGPSTTHHKVAVRVQLQRSGPAKDEEGLRNWFFNEAQDEANNLINTHRLSQEKARAELEKTVRAFGGSGKIIISTR